MAVMMISEVAGQTGQGYDHMLAAVGEELKQAPGLVMHMSHQVEDGWRIVEVWASKDHAARFFAGHVAPKLPAGIRPKLTFQPLYDIMYS